MKTTKELKAMLRLVDQTLIQAGPCSPKAVSAMIRKRRIIASELKRRGVRYA